MAVQPHIEALIEKLMEGVCKRCIAERAAAVRLGEPVRVYVARGGESIQESTLDVYFAGQCILQSQWMGGDVLHALQRLRWQWSFFNPLRGAQQIPVDTEPLEKGSHK